MSLESTIQENTEVMRTLISVLTTKHSPDNIGIPPVPPQEPYSPAPARPSPKKHKATAKPETEALQQSTAKPEPEPATIDESAYGPVRTAILDISKRKGRDVTLAILSKYGVDSGLKLHPVQYDRVLEDIEQVMLGSDN
jgi:hypothetical protein